MPIIVSCTGCGRKLKLAEQHAGKTARCPVCRMTFPVPADAPTSSGPTAEDVLHIGPDDSGPAPSSGAPTLSNLGGVKAPADAWYLRVPEGHQYGPVPKAEMDGWVKEGRVTAQCQLKSGDGPWQPAGAVYSFLGNAAPQNTFPNQPMQPTGGFGQPMQAPFNPYAGPMQPMGGQMPYGGFAYRKPHRGGLILVLSLLGFFCCPIFSLVGVAMAFNDLSEMERGQMDSSGQGITRGGQIVGIISLVLFGLGLLAAVGGAVLDM